jgi:hypothetical protein
MSNLSDKEIDRLSREAADSYEPDHSSLSWSRLEQKLTKQMPERPPDGFRIGRINPYVWGPAVVLLAGISFFLIKNNNYSQHSTRTSQPVNQPTPSSSADNGQANGNSIQLDSVSSSGDNVATDRKNASLSKQTNSTADAVTNNKKASSSDQQVPVTHEEGSNAVSAGAADKTVAGSPDQSFQVSNTDRINKNSGKKGPGVKTIVPVSILSAASFSSDGSIAANSNMGSRNPNGLDISRPSGDLNASRSSTGSNDNTAGIRRERSRLSLPLIASSGAGLGKVTGNDSLLNRLAQSSAPIHQKSLHLNRSLNLGLAFGPDYTDAGGITNNQLGNNIGLTIGYYLTRKFSVNTGIFYSNKFYWSPGHGSPTSIQQISNSRTYAALPPTDFVNGSTNMYELPLTLRYDFVNNEKTKFFVNAGLSSYFMVKQTYIYFFHSGTRPLAYKRTDDAQINYWFDVTDLSFGLETDMGKGFTFQAEPFFRIPIKDMGLENLKLNSYGFLLSFRYAPVLSRTKK